MREEYDFSNAVPNPYVGRVRRRVTINIDGEPVDYFKAGAYRCAGPLRITFGHGYLVAPHPEQT